MPRRDRRSACPSAASTPPAWLAVLSSLSLGDWNGVAPALRAEDCEELPVYDVSIRADCETAEVYFLLSKLALRWIQSDAVVVTPLQQRPDVA